MKTRNIILAIVSFAAGAILMSFLISWLWHGQTKSEKSFTLDPKNCTYNIEGKDVSLINGRAETEIAPGSASKDVFQYFGNEVRGDFNNDGFQDVAFLLTENSGGSGTFFYVAAALGSKDKCIGTNIVLLGDRIAPQTTEFNGDVIVNYAKRAENQPMATQPSIGATMYLTVLDNELVEVTK